MKKNRKLYPFEFGENNIEINESSVVASGFLANNTIEDITDTYMGEIMGNDAFQYYGGVFPIRIAEGKVEGKLGIQSHPDNSIAMERYDSIGKAKLWLITEASEDAIIYLGLKKELSASDFYTKALDSSLAGEMVAHHPEAGDCIYIKPGTLHGAEGNIGYIEISQNSEITYHLTGEECTLEISEAIDTVDLSAVKSNDLYFRNTSGNTTLADGSGFIIRKVTLQAKDVAERKRGYETFTLYLPLKGEGKLELTGKSLEKGKQQNGEVQKGKSSDNEATIFTLKSTTPLLVPSAVEEFRIEACEELELLEITLPEISELDEDHYLNYDEDESNYPDGDDDFLYDGEEFDDEFDEDDVDEEMECDDECDDDECGCGCEGHHGHHHSNHKHNHEHKHTHTSGHNHLHTPQHNHNNGHCNCGGEYVYRNPFEVEGEDNGDDERHPGERFFKH